MIKSGSVAKVSRRDEPDELERLTDIAVKLIWIRVIDAGLNSESFGVLRKEMADQIGNDGRVPPDPAAYFSSEHDLLLSTLTYLTASPTPTWMESAADTINRLQRTSEDQPREVRHEKLRRAIHGAGFPNSADDEYFDSFTRRIPFLAALGNFPEMEGAEADAAAVGLEDTYVRNRTRLQRVTEGAVGATGFRPATLLFGTDENVRSRAFEILTVLVSAAWEGNALRAGLDPVESGFPLPTGRDGETQTWHLANFAFRVCSSALLEDGPVDSTPFEMPSVARHPVLGFGDGPKDEIVRFAARSFIERAVEAFERPVFFEDVRLAAATADPPLDPADFWNDPLSMWGALLDRMTNAESQLVTEEWIDDAGPGTSLESIDHLLETCRLVGVHDGSDTVVEAAFIRRLGLIAYLHSTSGPGRSVRIASCEKVEDGYRRMRNSFEQTTRSYARQLGVRPTVAIFGAGEEAEAVAFELISAVTGVIYEGLRLRTPVDPAVGTIELPTGPNGEKQEWNFFGLAYWCVASTCFEPVPEPS